MRTMEPKLCKRFLALFLSLLLIVSILPSPQVTAVEAEETVIAQEATEAPAPKEPAPAETEPVETEPEETVPVEPVEPAPTETEPATTETEDPMDPTPSIPENPDPTYFTVTPVASEHGSVRVNNASEPIRVLDGVAVEIAVTAEAHYKIASLTIGGTAVSLTKNQTTYSGEYIPTSDVTVAAQFELLQYEVTLAGWDENLGIVQLGEGSQPVLVPDGESVKLTAIPAENYHIEAITVQYSDKTSEAMEIKDPKNFAEEYTPKNDCTIAVKFAIDSFKVSVKVTGDGSVAAKGVTVTSEQPQELTAEVNTTLKFDIRPSQNYYLARITLDGVEIKNGEDSAEDTYTTPAITKDISLAFAFQAMDSVTPAIGEELDNDYYTVEFAWINGKSHTGSIEKEDGTTEEVILPVPVQKNVDAKGRLTGVVLPDDAQVIFKPKESFKWIKWDRKGSRERYKEALAFTAKTEEDLSALTLIVAERLVLSPAVTVNVPFAINFDKTSPQVTVTVNGSSDADPISKVYGTAVTLTVKVTEDLANIQGACYTVYAGAEILDGYKERELALTAEGLTYTGTIQLPATVNGSNIRVEVTAVSEIGYTGTGECNLAINTVAPKMEIKFYQEKDVDGAMIRTYLDVGNDVTYYQKPVNVEVTIWDKDYSFASAFVEKSDETAPAPTTEPTAEISPVPGGGSILIKTEKETQESVFGELEFKQVEGDPDDQGRTAYRATFTLNPSSNYTLSELTYTNKAGNSADVDPSEYKVTVDNVKPTGEITIEKTWTELLETLTFGHIKNETANVTVIGKDETSPVTTFSYYLSTGEEAKTILTEEDLSGKSWIQISPDVEATKKEFQINMPEMAVIYLKIVDAAGNYNIISSQGIIVEDIKPTVTITPAHEAPYNGFYNTAYQSANKNQVDFNIHVEDPENVKSGIASVTWYYTVNGQKKTPKDSELFSFAWTDNNTYKPISDTFSKDFKVSVPMNESNGTVVVYVDVTDNAGNSIPASAKSAPIKIDTVAPTINVSYDKNGQRYYNTDRVATVAIEEVNFSNPTSVRTNITTSGGAVPGLGGWDNSGTTHKAKLVFHADGDYNFTGVTYTDAAGNPASAAVFANVSDNHVFTIDQTAPVITVSYDNNNAANDKYFNAPRTATVTVNEHNFDPSRVVFNPEQNVTWSNSGDTHTATISFAENRDYTFDVSATDLANNNSLPVNYGDSVAPNAFTVDTIYEDMIHISGVDDGNAYSYADVVIPNVKIEDINFDTYELTLIGVQRGNTVDLTEEVNRLVQKSETGITGLFDVFRKTAEYDGIYTLYVKGVDKAGNVDEEQIRFTVNRFGSVYEYSDNLLELIENGGTYNQSIDEDLTFTIYNASPIDPDNISVVITRDGRPVEALFTVDELTADGEGWYSYLVTIDPSNFAEDGVYTVSVTTTDDADNTVENTGDNSDGDILFYVDSTAPQLTSVNGLEESIVNATELEVSYTVYDTIGLASVQVKVDGEIVDSATEFDDASNYSGKFTIHEKSSAQHVSFILTDKAGNVTDSDAEGFEVPYVLERNVTVSTNLLVRWFANKPLFYGGIGGVAILGGLGALLGLKKKKKKEVSVD